jgi:hypothetical protein
MGAASHSISSDRSHRSRIPGLLDSAKNLNCLFSVGFYLSTMTESQTYKSRNAKTSLQMLAMTDGDRLSLVGNCVGTHLDLRTQPFTVVDGVPQRCACPYCRRDLNITVNLPKPVGPSRPSRSAPVLCEREFAYVALLYGGHPAYFVGAMVTGWSLQAHTSLSREDRVLLCTDDVPERYRSILSSVWTVRPVEYITKAPPKCYWDYSKSRFKEVFTKLRIFSVFAGKYRKVILLDLDLLIRGEMDSLFQLSAPAAMVRGQGYIKHGDTVPIDYFYSGHRQVLGINCGVMLIEPSETVFQKMEEEIKDYGHPEHWPTHGPEQDYLSRYFNAFSSWTNISCRYNYQVHLTQFGSPEWHHLNTVGHKKVSVFHYSGRLVRPWDMLLDLVIVHGMEDDRVDKFIREEMPRVAAEAHTCRLNNTIHPLHTKRIVSTPFRASKFCGGDDANMHCSNKCFFNRYIHPSWTKADSEACVEWLKAFQDADAATGHEISRLLRTMYDEEVMSHLDGTDSDDRCSIGSSDIDS